MLHDKFHDHRTISSVGKDFLNVFTVCMDVEAILIIRPR